MLWVKKSWRTWIQLSFGFPRRGGGGGLSICCKLDECGIRVGGHLLCFRGMCRYRERRRILKKHEGGAQPRKGRGGSNSTEKAKKRLQKFFVIFFFFFLCEEP